MILIVQISLQSSGTLRNIKDSVKTAPIRNPNNVTYFLFRYGTNRSVIQYASVSAEAIIAIFR